jgi:hypothetical protein
MIKEICKRVFLPIPKYSPTKKVTPERLLNATTAWKGLECVLADIIERFSLPTESCLEFGVEFGYSTVALSNFFRTVKGVDLFAGDIHTHHKGDHFELTKKTLEPYANIEVFKADYRDWTKQDDGQYGLIHVDIVHTYKDTYDCGLWSARHSNCTIFHDTESFLGVRRAVRDIAKATGKRVFNYPHCHGLGIVV